MWFFIWLVTILIPIGSAGYLAFDDPEAVVDNWSGMDRLGAGRCPGVPSPAGRDRHRAGRDLAPSDLLPTASWPLMVLSFTYAIRSLRPSYSGEELTYLPGVSDTVHAIFLVLTALLLLASVVLGVVLSAPGSAQTRDVPRRRMRPPGRSVVREAPQAHYTATEAARQARGPFSRLYCDTAMRACRQSGAGTIFRDRPTDCASVQGAHARPT